MFKCRKSFGVESESEYLNTEFCILAGVYVGSRVELLMFQILCDISVRSQELKFLKSDQEFGARKSLYRGSVQVFFELHNPCIKRQVLS